MYPICVCKYRQRGSESNCQDQGHDLLRPLAPNSYGSPILPYEQRNVFSGNKQHLDNKGEDQCLNYSFKLGRLGV